MQAHIRTEFFRLELTIRQLGNGVGDEPFNNLSNAFTQSPPVKSLEFVLKNRVSGIRSGIY